MQETTKRAYVKFAPNTDGFWPELKKEVDIATPELKKLC